MGRAFNTIEDAVRTWSKENTERLLKYNSKGIFCRCSCYSRKNFGGKAEYKKTCMFILPEKIYNKYKKFSANSTYGTRILGPGVIKAVLYPDDKDNYSVKTDFCERKWKFQDLLGLYVGCRIRLGKNILARKKFKSPDS